MGIRRTDQQPSVTPLRPIASGHDAPAQHHREKPRLHTREELVLIRFGRREGLLLGALPGFLLGALAMWLFVLIVAPQNWYRDGIIHGQALEQAAQTESETEAVVQQWRRGGE